MARLILLLTFALSASAQDEHFQKAGSCGRCHVISVIEWGIARHAATGTDCTACHGASQGHVIDERNNIKPDRIPRGAAASAPLCSTCHPTGCPKSKKTASCTDCHHFHALLDPAKPPATNDDRADRLAAAWREADRHLAEGERLLALSQFTPAQTEFQAALAARPSDLRARARLNLCRRRLHPALPGFQPQGRELDPVSGLARQVRLAVPAIEMILIPGGETDIGSDRYSASQPVHTVTVDPFYLGKYEITQAEWAAVMQTPAPAPAVARLPATNISWDDAQEFVRRLNAQIPGAGLRLPTEAEWEHAARQGGVTATAAATAWFDGKPAPRPVGQGQPDRLGLYDLQGNVWEWCANSYTPYPDQAAQATPLKVLRGGGYPDTPDLLDPALRHAERANRRLPMNGLRLARTPPPAT